MRHPVAGSVKAAALTADCPVINAGDGGHLHPTQTLTDLLTLREEKGTLENLCVGFCGDLKNGRTVHSLIKAMSCFKGTSFVLKGLKAGEKYTLAIAAVAPNGKTVGKKTAVKSNTLTKRWMKSIKVTKVKPGKKKVTIKWKKISGATGYQVLYSKNGKTWKSKFIKGGKKTSTTIKKLSKGKWYVRVRAVKSGYLGVLCVKKSCKVK